MDLLNNILDTRVNFFSLFFKDIGIVSLQQNERAVSASISFDTEMRKRNDTDRLKIEILAQCC
jgi:hypothetical protein